MVAIDDAMGQIIWTRNFLTGQGKSITMATNIYQDNKSTILLAENGKGSSSRRTKHLDIRYFFVTDKIKKADVKISYCPTHEMISYFFTKPLQAAQFVCMRRKILNLPSDASVTAHRSVLGKSKV